MSKKVIDTAREMAQPIADNLQLELVDIEFVKEGQNWFLRVFIDSDNGVDIEECAKVSELLSEKLDEADPISQNYFLEVSSPGAERPLKKRADFDRSLGKNVYIKTYEPIDGVKVFEGELAEFDGQTVTVEMTIKTRKKRINIPYEKIANARLAVSFQ
ncbi:ribosome maturation factor RimP [Bacillus atrophaeus]|uniref:ribosome maturation factor RimP n=1 Tax=Bacillus atrophaeus TaxID=1452 RepID=UPI0022809419|nr:ribosome maturation factor RimP [Bacillus atrophaeus]MCY8464456.1 ribosome maturation factor RimP [Bacillus atrophaeus]MCY8475909.1 ribosome maturation factor RimP [Bacillus atrophaeus]MCY8970215.1 ribosome maturation factor RimP [Bacillus atrophaeus]MCY9109192.1 ribosome maturation factor RimP [Bacillus atrophaeus]MCY9164936.1 ribosome maturation factor RimP [Bacillus atrophaeus]